VPIAALVEMMATRLRAKAPACPVAAAASQAPASAGGRDTSRGGSRGDFSARKGTAVDDRICYSCGEMGHASRNCTNKCKKCGLRDCTGNYDAKTCLLATSRAIPAVVLNAGGVPVLARIRDWLVKKHAAKYPSASAADDRADSDNEILSDAGVGAIVLSGAWLGAGYDGPAAASCSRTMRGPPSLLALASREAAAWHTLRCLRAFRPVCSPGRFFSGCRRRKPVRVHHRSFPARRRLQCQHPLGRGSLQDLPPL